MPFWFNVSTGQVEEDARRSRDDEVMGPYDTHEQAAGALQHAAENTQRWDDEDREWEEKGTRN